MKQYHKQYYVYLHNWLLHQDRKILTLKSRKLNTETSREEQGLCRDSNSPAFYSSVIWSLFSCPAVLSMLIKWPTLGELLHTTITTTTVLRPFFRDHLGEPVPEENFWTLWCKGRLTEADTSTIWLGATPSGLTSAHLHHPPFFYRPDALPDAQPTVSKHWRHTLTYTYILYAYNERCAWTIKASPVHLTQ